ncbi:hypothetical protein BN59_03710 [Legionella massiliensis]|uniref:Uncharacterized protein n=1 Tax=Legionella massiliensis TaxID=1034943 RepID=A0A078L2F0_9GAMM|nr:hypothetical protein [Legionella massiliensis]CDZ79392.1 hypothetical protein BN59_03710 [Legionella massiliensis]CEE15130.1 hypothetical protein BN1094_03710 [Legionella massiliensis]
MKQIPQLKQFTREELYSLLRACSESLALAYQDNLQSDFLDIAMAARLACESLRFEIDSQNKEYSIH